MFGIGAQQSYHTTHVIDLPRVVLENVCFEYDGKNYYQVVRTAMGTKVVLSYANILVSNFERNLCFHIVTKLLLWKTFMDGLSSTVAELITITSVYVCLCSCAYLCLLATDFLGNS